MRRSKTPGDSLPGSKLTMLLEGIPEYNYIHARSHTPYIEFCRILKTLPYKLIYTCTTGHLQCTTE